MNNKKMADPQASHKANNSANNPTTEAEADVSTQPATLILELQKNSRERIRIAHTTYKGRPYIDMRVWYVDGAGDYRPSRSGVSIRPDQIGEVMRGLGLAARGIDPKGAN
jgi:hypothetical protein